MDPVAKLPGVTFHVQQAKLTDKLGVVVLDATVTDLDLWDQVLKKLNGYRVYAVSDLQSALIECMQEENKAVRTVHAREVAALREELERAKQRVSVLEQEALEHTAFNEELKKLEKHGIRY